MSRPFSSLETGNKPDGFEGVMPLARQLGELTGRTANCPARPLEELRPISANVVGLNPRAWGFKSRAEMEAAFGEVE